MLAIFQFAKDFGKDYHKDKLDEGLKLGNTNRLTNETLTAVLLNAGIKGLYKDHGSLEKQDSIDTFG